MTHAQDTDQIVAGTEDSSSTMVSKVAAVAVDTVKRQWDAVNGIWQGISDHGDDVELPSPLWIFGYGSLIWPTLNQRYCGGAK